MNDPAVKVALAISVLLGGMFLATVFRPGLSTPPAAMSELKKPLSLQQPRQGALLNPSLPEAAVSKQAAEQTAANTSESAREPTILLPLGPPQPVPNLPARYPAAASTNSASWGMPREMMPVVARQASGPLMHKIVDGDTLRDLAERYLGSPDRAEEIFQTNRDVLADPKLLPIGVILKIPARVYENAK
jgi:nucleoid-associated protein YgaU